MFENTWNRIIEWFRDRSERTKLVRNFNEAARNAFVLGSVPTLLKADFSKGVKEYRHELSAWINTGFRVQAFSGRPLSRAELQFIGITILSDETLIRRLIALGWDTLEVHDNKGTYGLRWKMMDHVVIGGILPENN